MPALRGDVTTLREVAISDVYTLFTLFSDPAVTAYMAPPPPTLATFAGLCAIAVHTPPCGDWGAARVDARHGVADGRSTRSGVGVDAARRRLAETDA